MSRPLTAEAREFLEEACLHYGVRPGTEDYDAGYGDSAERRQRAAQILRLHPEIGRESIHAAVVCGDLAEVERVLSERPESASEKGGPQGWEPLLYLCFGRLPTAAVGQSSVAIARALLDRGADPHDLQGFYNTALWHDDDRWLELLWAHGMKPGTLDSLGHAVERNHLARAEWLLKHGASANAVDHYRKQNLPKLALLNGLSDMAALLARFGAEPVAIEERARRLGLDAVADRLAESQPET